jgi:lysophospholipase L1-like esterase
MNAMKWTGTILLAMALAVPLAGAVDAARPLKDGCRIAIIGDSITEQRLYSNFIETYLLACCPELKAVVFQFGWSGENAAGFEKRMDNDMAWFKPDVATICFGMNDGRYSRLTPELERSFQVAMQKIMGTLKKNGTFAVVGGPGAVDTKCFRPRDASHSANAEVYNETLHQLSAVSSNLAVEAGFTFANLHQTMMEAMARAKQARGMDYVVCGMDGVHPSPNGHLIMAYAFLKALHVSGEIGTIRVSMKDGRATATSGHKVLSAAGGRVELESVRYPYCFTDKLRYPPSVASKSADPLGAATMLPFIPFNQELNRLVLKVDGVAWDKAKVTWGAKSKVFSKGDLEAGVNLAAEFAEGNPFTDAFTKVQLAVALKQEFETLLVKSWLTKVPSLKKLLSGDSSGLDDLGETSGKLMAAWESLRESAVAEVVPVRHTIVIENAEQVDGE